ncbi:MAG TPA: sulfotransferase [Candidatus Acidoferrales bacterium]|jgi:tetratricopeptide (TPR) repeat protein|nr:sulfotransferase [Candidatus Acidoferrales bacterium]
MSQPNKPNPVIQQLYREANQAWEQQDYQKSISLFEQAARKEPHNPALLLNLVRAHGKRYDFPAAERCLEKAVQISTNRAQTLGEAGQVCLEFDNFDLAISCFQRASEKKGVSISVLVNLAEIYIRDKRLDEGAELVARAGQMDRKDARVRVQDAVLRKLRGNVAEAESLLSELLAIPTVGASVRIRAHYEMASIKDNAGNYDAAMTALLEAKALLRPHMGPHAATLQHMQSRAAEMEKSITAAVMDRWRADADKLQPLRRIALLCGHPRSGTTLLEQVLDAHSDITSAEETKVMHDDAYLPLIRDFPEGTSILEALDSVPPSIIRHARENYFRCMEMFLGHPIGGHLLLDKNPGMNLMIPIVVRVFPETKFLIALRDPRDVVMSCFMQALPPTPISSAYLTLEGTVNQYANVMGFWLDMLPRMGNQWMYVRYEKMVEDLPGVARSVLSFLGAEFEDGVLKFYEHARSKRVVSPSRDDVRKPLYQKAIGRWRNYQKYLEPYLPVLDRFVKAFNYD